MSCCTAAGLSTTSKENTRLMLLRATLIHTKVQKITSIKSFSGSLTISIKGREDHYWKQRLILHLEEVLKLRHYLSTAGSIVWTAGAVTMATFRSPGPDSADFSRISLYSWQIAQRWQKKWVMKSSHGASYKITQKKRWAHKKSSWLTDLSAIYDHSSLPSELIIKITIPPATYEAIFSHRTPFLVGWLQFKNISGFSIQTTKVRSFIIIFCDETIYLIRKKKY